MTALVKTATEDIQFTYRELIHTLTSDDTSRVMLLAHYGDFNQVKIDHILRLVESSVLEQGDKRQSMKRVYGVMVEILQNMAIHSTRDRDHHMHGFVILSRMHNQYTIHSGNLVLNVDREGLENRMEGLLAMDKNQVRKAYIDTLCNDSFSDKGGAGLGLLTIVKRAIEPVEYQVQMLQDPFAYFRMTVIVESE